MIRIKQIQQIISTTVPIAFLSLGLLLSFPVLTSAKFTIFPAQPHNHQFNYEIKPGAIEKGEIVVKNLDSEPITVHAYGVDATTSNQGTFALTSSSTPQQHIGKWVTFEDQAVTINGYQEKNIPFTITIPKITTPGDYSGGIAVEDVTDDILHQDSSKGATVNVAARMSAKLFIHVPGEKKHAFLWNNFSFENGNDETRSTFLLSFQNTGNTIILAEPTLEFIGFPVLHNQVLHLPVATLQPDNEEKKVEKRWDEKVGWGLYVVKANVIFSEFDITNDTKINSQALSRYILVNFIPAPIIALFGISIILIIVLIVLRHRAYTLFLKGCVEYKVRSGEEISDIAKDHHISWKKLTKINKLTPPYTLLKGQILLVPPLHKNPRFKKSSP